MKFDIIQQIQLHLHYGVALYYKNREKEREDNGKQILTKPYVKTK